MDPNNTQQPNVILNITERMKEKKKLPRAMALLFKVLSLVPYTFIPAIFLLFKTDYQLPYILFVYGLKSFSLSMILDLGEVAESCTALEDVT